MRTVKALCPLLALALLLAGAPKAAADGVATSAEAAVLIEANSGRVLLEKEAARRLPQASTTKIMTALIALESGLLDTIVTVSERAAGVEGSSLCLKAGETLPLLELVYGLMLQSGNDAAVAIAEAVAGSVDAFVERMNETAAFLGLSDTHFCNPNGLPDPAHYTTARDLAALSAHAMQNEIFRRIVRTQYHVAEGCSTPRTFRNKNRLLREYEGCVGIKTGYTKAAGKCLSFCAERGGMLLVGVVLNAPQMWNDAKSMLNYGFNAYRVQCVARANTIFWADVQDGVKKALPAALKSDILYPIRIDGEESLSSTVTFYDSVAAPVYAGQQIGSVLVRLSGDPVLEMPIIALETVPRRTYLHTLKRLLREAAK